MQSESHGRPPDPSPGPTPTDEWMRVFAKMLIRVPAYLRLGWALGRSHDIPRRHKHGLFGAALYQLAPVDLVPNLIPVIGQLDDLAALLYGIRSALRHCPPEAAERMMAKAGVSSEQLDQDIADLGVVAKGFGRSVVKGAWKGSKATARLMGRGVVAGARVAWSAYRRRRA